MTGVQARVQAGINWLDDIRPQWRDRITVSTLDIADPCSCILGQVFGRDWEGADYPGWAWELGFELPRDEDADNDTFPWRPLQAEWVRRLA